MANQIISEEFRRMQKLAGLSEAWEEVDLTGNDDEFEAGDFVTYNEKIYMIQGIYPDDTMTIALANLSPSVKPPYGRLEVKISDVKKYTGKPEDIPVQSEALNEVIEDDGEDGEPIVIRKFNFGSSGDPFKLELYSDGSIEIFDRSNWLGLPEEDVKDLFEILKRIMK